MNNHLRELRAEHGWSQAHLAELLDMGIDGVFSDHVGRYDPSLPLAFAISRLFQQPIESIFNPDQEPA